MTDYEPIKMAELVRVEDTGDLLTLVFQNGRTLRISNVNGKLVSDLG